MGRRSRRCEDCVSSQPLPERSLLQYRFQGGEEEELMENYVMVDDRYVKDLEESLELCEKSYAEVNTNLILLEAENRGLRVQVEDLRKDLETVKGHAKKFAGELMDLRAENLNLRFMVKDWGERFMKGGSWLYDLDYARAVYRYGHPLDYRDLDIGFRVVRVGGGNDT